MLSSRMYCGTCKEYHGHDRDQQLGREGHPKATLDVSGIAQQQFLFLINPAI